MAIFNILLPLLVVVLVFGGVIYLAVSRSLEMKELTESGIEANGTVTEKKSLPNSRSSTRKNKIAYTYTDQQGQAHASATFLPYDEYDKYQVGGPIDIVYSSKRPSVSAPLYYVALARQALSKKS